MNSPLFLRKGFYFNQASFPYFVTQSSGFGNPEAWGRWSQTNDGQAISLTFVKPLPKQFFLLLRAKGFGPNIGAPTTIKIGSTTHQIILSDQMQLFTLSFTLSKPSNTVQIIPPHAISPQQLDPRNADTRKIGIGMQSMAFGF